MKNVLLTILKIVIPLGIGVYFTWLFISKLSAEGWEDLKIAFVQADYTYIVFGIVIMLLSHMSRAYRWKYMLEPLGHKPNFWKMYHSVMIGYVINLTIPRSGELARAAYYAKYQKGVASEKVFGTIIVERVIDVLMLGLVFTTTIYLQKDVEAFNEIKNGRPEVEGFPDWINYIYYIVGLLVVAGVIAFFASGKIRNKIIDLFKGILEGVKTILQLKQRMAYIGHTLFIWLCYLGMLWVCAFALPETAGLEIAAVFAAFVVGAVAISTTPGGMGLYPILVAGVLTNLYGIENAKSFSMLAWTALTLFTIICGLFSLIALPIISKKQA